MVFLIILVESNSNNKNIGDFLLRNILLLCVKYCDLFLVVVMV